MKQPLELPELAIWRDVPGSGPEKIEVRAWKVPRAEDLHMSREGMSRECTCLGKARQV